MKEMNSSNWLAQIHKEKLEERVEALLVDFAQSLGSYIYGDLKRSATKAAAKFVEELFKEKIK